MLRLIFAALIAVTFVTAAYARWSSAGWYVVLGAGAGTEIVNGPHTGEEECKRHIVTPDTEHCSHLETQPEWDK